MEAIETTPVRSASGKEQVTVQAPELQSASVRGSQARRPQKRMNWPLLAAAATSGIACFALGGLVARARYHAGEAVVAVNGAVIDRTAFYNQLENKDGAAIIRQMVGEELRYQFAKKVGLAPTDAVVDAKIAELAAAQPGVAQALKDGRLSMDEARREIRAKLVKDAVVTNGIQVNDADVRRYYEQNINKKNPQAQFYTPETAQIQVIITRTKARADQAVQALANNATWDVVAGAYSEDQSKLNGGLLPPIKRGRTISSKVPGLEATIFGLKIGEQSQPRQFEKVWWIIRCVDKSAETTEPFDKVKDQCVLGAKFAHLPPTSLKKVETDFVDFQRKSTVQAFWPRYKQAVTVK